LGSILARESCTLINVDLAIFSFKSQKTLARVIINAVNAIASVFAWFGSALVNVDFAMLTFKSELALAFIGVDLIVAYTFVLALVEISCHAQCVSLILVELDFSYRVRFPGQASRGYIVDAIAPVRELLGARLAFADGIVCRSSVASVIIITEALAVPLQTSVLESSVSASFEANFSLIGSGCFAELEILQSVLHVPLWEVLEASEEWCSNSGNLCYNDGSCALVNVGLAIVSIEARCTFACVIRNAINAHTTVLAWTRSAIINVD
jgi:hypothetical protein